MGSTAVKAWERLRLMKDPASRRDIVSLGLAKDVELIHDKVIVQLVPPEGDVHQQEALATAIRRELGGLEGINKVVVKWVSAGSSPEPSNGTNGLPEKVSVHLPILEDASNPEHDAMNASMGRAGIAPEVGYGEGGPEDISSPESALPHDRYEEWPPVYQWEIDPADPTLVSGEEHVRIGDWEYDIWWQAHPADLIYASIQAMADDSITNGPQRQHPVGRNVAVNLVFDRRRAAVLTVYGTARDFRPFIEAFRMGCNLEEHAKESNQ